MIVFLVILVIVSVIGTGFALWALTRLNKYIGSLENQIEGLLDRIDELDTLLRESNIKGKKIVKRNLMPEDDE